MKPTGHIWGISMKMRLNLKYISSELLSFLTGRGFYFWRISNDAREGAFPLSILVYGRQSIADDVVAAFFNNKGFVKTRLSHCAPRKAAKLLPSFRKQNDSLIIRERPFWKGGRGEKEILFQTHLNTSIAIKTREFPELVKQEMGKPTRKEVMRSIKRFHRQVRETCDLSEILDFHRNLLVPCAQALHGKQADCPTVDDLIRMADKLTLFLIEQEGHPVAGLLAYHSKHLSSLTMWYVGMELSILKDSKLKSQYNLGLFSLALKMACKLKVASISDGITYPIMNHGNLNYKIRLSSQPMQLPHYPMCSLEFSEGKKAEILAHYPLLGIKDNELYGMIGVTQELPPDSIENHFNSFLKKSSFKGLSTIKYFVQKDKCSKTFMDRLRRMNLHSYAFQDAQAQEEHAILTFQRTTQLCSENEGEK